MILFRDIAALKSRLETMAIEKILYVVSWKEYEIINY
jgi:hypothetical protein